VITGKSPRGSVQAGAETIKIAHPNQQKKTGHASDPHSKEATCREQKTPKMQHQEGEGKRSDTTTTEIRKGGGTS